MITATKTIPQKAMALKAGEYLLLWDKIGISQGAEPVRQCKCPLGNIDFTKAEWAAIEDQILAAYTRNAVALGLTNITKQDSVA